MMYLLYYGVIDFYIGFLAGVKAFTAAVLGGIGSLPGAMLGGLLIGLIETFWSAYFSRRIQGRRGLLDPRDRADLPALRPARPAGSREGLSRGAADPTGKRRRHEAGSASSASVDARRRAISAATPPSPSRMQPAARWVVASLIGCGDRRRCITVGARPRLRRPDDRGSRSGRSASRSRWAAARCRRRDRLRRAAPAQPRCSSSPASRRDRHAERRRPRRRDAFEPASARALGVAVPRWSPSVLPFLLCSSSPATAATSSISPS